MTEKTQYQIDSEHAQLFVFIERINSAVEKLAEASSSVSKLLAVHEHKLTIQDKAIDKFDEKIEHVNSIIELKYKELMLEIKELRAENQKQHEEMAAELATAEDQLNAKISKIQKTHYMILGAFLAIQFILQFLPKISAILS